MFPFPPPGFAGIKCYWKVACSFKVQYNKEPIIKISANWITLLIVYFGNRCIS